MVDVAVGISERGIHRCQVLRIVTRSSEHQQHARPRPTGELERPSEDAPWAHHSPQPGADEATAAGHDPAIDVGATHRGPLFIAVCYAFVGTDTAQDAMVRRRMRRAQAISNTEAKARIGWKGANQVIAPDVPRARRTSLLQTGHPTAKNASSPPTDPTLAALSMSSLPGSRT